MARTALANGDLRFLKAATSRNCVGFARRAGDQEAVVVFNRSDRPTAVNLPLKALAYFRYRDALGEQALRRPRGAVCMSKSLPADLRYCFPSPRPSV